MRLYSFVNQYLSGAHIGIQTAHAVAELFLKHPDDPYVKDWAQNHKTIICLNGGDHKSLREAAWDVFSDLPYPYAHFEERGLRDTCTSIVIVVPEIIYKTARIFRDSQINAKFDLNQGNVNSEQAVLIDYINSCALAK